MLKTESNGNLHKYGIQHNLNLDVFDQSGPKTKNLFIEYFLKN